MPTLLLGSAAVVDDLLYAFLGLSGTYVRARPVNAPGGARLGYEVAPRGQLEPALQEMATRMLPIWCAGQLAWASLLRLPMRPSVWRSSPPLQGLHIGGRAPVRLPGAPPCLPAASMW